MTDTLIEFIEQEREKRGWSISELARRADLANTTINDVLLKKRNPGLTFCTQIAKVLGVSPGTLLEMADLVTKYDRDSPTIRDMLFLFDQLTDEQQELVLAQMRGITTQMAHNTT